jgi:DNA polymerase-1
MRAFAGPRADAIIAAMSAKDKKSPSGGSPSGQPARPAGGGLLAILDGHGIIHRAYHAVKEPLTVRKTGEVVTAVYGLANTLLSVLEELKPTHIAVALDAPGPTFRHEMDETYKAHRVEAPEDLKEQIGRCVELIESFNIPIYQKQGFEADDVLGTLARQAVKAKVDTFLVTLDSDIVQLVRPGVRVFMFRPYQRDTVVYDEEQARERYGIEPAQMPDLKGLKGDASDNIPGVPGIGDKTAVKLLQQFGSVEDIYKRLSEVQPEKLRELLRTHEEQARHSKEMATIVTDAPVTLNLDECRVERFDRAKVLAMFRDLEFRSLLGRLPDYGEAGGQPAPVAAEEEAPTDYRAVLSEKDLDALVKRLRKAGSFAFDTETTDIAAMRADLVGISLSTELGKAWYVPVGHQAGLGEAPQLPLALVLERLGPLFEDVGVEKTAHNGKFDMLVLARQGVWTRGLTFDTMIAAYLLGEGSLGLKWLASKRLGVEMTPITELIGPAGPKQRSMSQVGVEAATSYASADADMTLRLRAQLEEELREQNLWPLFSDIEMPLVPVLTRMEMAGVALDEKVLRGMSQELRGQVAKVEKRIYAEVGHEFNIGSPQQLSGVLFEELGLPKNQTRKTKYGYSTDAQVLDGLRGAHPVVDLILEYRSATKLVSTYVDTLPVLVDPRTKRIHTTFNQTVAATGRLSSNDPNLQNIPVRGELGGQVRTAFVARDIGPDPYLLAADYSQIELRILAHLCQDPGLLEAFRQDEDIHAATASQVFGVALDKVTSEMRRRAKVFNFGVLYGLSEFGLAQREGISREEAAEFIETYFKKYERVKEWREDVIAETRRLGYAETLAGRRRYIPEINSSNFQARSAAERMAVNMPIQGTASDIIKIAMNRIDAEMEERKLKTKMLLQVHDELIFEGPKKELDDVREMVVRVMPLRQAQDKPRQAQGGLESLSQDVPLKIDVKVGRNWGEMG